MSSTTTTATTIAMAIAATIFLAACGKTEQTAQPGTTTPATPASAPGSQSKDDLARIRDLMEKDEARRVAEEAQAKSIQQQISDGGKAPLLRYGR